MLGFLSAPYAETKTNEKHINISDAAEYLQVSKQTVYKYCRDRILPFYKKKRRLYFLEEDLKLFIKSGERSTADSIRNQIFKNLN